jgi:hypothetical protein
VGKGSAGSGMTRGDRRRNARRARLWAVLLRDGAVIGIDLADEKQALEGDGGVLVEPVIDPQHPDAGAVVDGGELVVLVPARAGQRGDELDVDLDGAAGLRLLIPFNLRSWRWYC